MKKGWFFIFALIMALGCARVMVETPKEPIKVDISMRLDVYQHIAKDIDAIEGIVSGEAKTSSDKESLLNLFVACAYAKDLSPEVEDAALRRRDRRAEISSWQEEGVVGENRSGFLEIRNAAQADSALRQLVEAENNDRMVIYQAVAEKNGVGVKDIQKIYAKRLQDDAPAGTPIEIINQSGNYQKLMIEV